MLKINKKLEYALIALKHLHTSKNKACRSARSISETYHIPFDTTSRVMQQMATHGYLQAAQGPQGGYRIAKDLKMFSFLELAEVILGPIALANCVSPSHNCDIKDTCNITMPIWSINQKLMDLCSNITLDELLNTQSIQSQLTGSTS